MGSLDNVYDTIQKLEDHGIEYLLITIEKGKKQGKADVFYSLKDKASMKILSRGFAASILVIFVVPFGTSGLLIFCTLLVVKITSVTFPV